MRYRFLTLKAMLIAKKQFIFLVLLQTVIVWQGLSQKGFSAAKYGKLSSLEQGMKVCPFDTTAHAFYIFDHGQSSFLVTPDVFKVTFERHFRIRITDKAAFDEANIRIPLYYKDNKSEEKLVDLKGITYNMENGQLTETKLERSAIFKENTSEHWSQTKFTMPNIKEGSIIEVRYKIESDFIFNFQGWVFQYDIPVLESEYLTAVPDLIKYNPYSWGYIPVNITKEDRPRPGYTFREDLTGYLARNVPAFPSEPHVKNKDNYRSRVEFELASTQFSNNFKEYTNTWSSINRLLLEDENFGLQLKKAGYFKDEVEAIQAKYSTPADKISAAYNLIKKKMTWNGSQRIYTSGNIRKAYEMGKGNVAEINLCLVSMLRELGLNANPVILSTVDNGMILPTFPTVAKMNYVIACVYQGDKYTLLDAADPFATPTLLPGKCINGQGRLINEQQGIWVDLKPGKIEQHQAYYKLDLDPEKGFKGDYTERNFNYSGYLMRHKLGDSTDLPDYITELHNKHAGTQITEATMQNFNDHDKDIIIQGKYQTKNNLEVTDELIYFNPVQMEKMEENPFKLEDRQFPVEFKFPWLVNSTVEIAIPKTYALESAPKSAVFQNADKTAKFTFTVEAQNDTLIKVNSLLIITKALYNVDEYKGLKEFFGHVVAKHAEQVVLKKKA